MRYSESKERTAELLRLALGHMGRHAAAFNPVTFTLWYEYVAGINPGLASSVDRLIKDESGIDDDEVVELYKRHIAPADEQTMKTISGEMERLMASMVQTASQTGERAGTFGDQLSGLNTALASRDVEQLKPRLTEVMAGTAEMKSSVEALRQKVTASQDEINRLRSDLERARDDAILDPMTGILNRRGFEKRIESLLTNKPIDGTSHCLVMLDIDHFKKVNDTHGHLMGDRVIQAVGEILRTSVTNGTHAAARYGGEEFALLLPQTSLDQSIQLAETVRTRIKAMKIRHRTTQEVLLTVTISGGVAEMRPDDDASSLIARADAALYQAKTGGRDRVARA
ncbi:MAG TPA: GGDEF domain-containing protein [Burkholderiaceae bacterium]|nr:GGDEF domain-containing protein [Burkholderiaceae bacterium]